MSFSFHYSLMLQQTQLTLKLLAVSVEVSKHFSFGLGLGLGLSRYLWKGKCVYKFYNTHSHLTDPTTLIPMQVVQCMRTKISWKDLQLFRNVIFILATEGWQKAIDEKDDLKAVDRVVENFIIPLQAANVVVEEIHAEFDDIQYLSQSTMNCHAVFCP